MENTTIQFCGELRGETDKCWFVYDGIEEIPIPKSQVKSMRKIGQGDNYEITIPTWLAAKKGII